MFSYGGDPHRDEGRRLEEGMTGLIKQHIQLLGDFRYLVGAAMTACKFGKHGKSVESDDAFEELEE